MFTEGMRPVLGRVIRHFRVEDAGDAGEMQAPTEQTPGTAGESEGTGAVLAFPAYPFEESIEEAQPDARFAFEAEMVRLAQALLDLSDATCLAALNLSIQASRLGEPGKALMSASNDIEGLTAESKHASERLYQLLTSAEAVR